MSTLALTPGSTLGSFEIEALLGSGGMGEVYRGYDTKLQRRVAIKAIRRQYGVDAELKARFLREARILSKLEHPAICQVYDLLETPDADYLIFEFVEGQTLRQLMAAGKLPRERALALAEKVARALAAAHGERVVHRDLKPENLMVTPAGEIKILDFGISRSLDGSGGPAAPSERRAVLSASLRETVDLRASTQVPPAGLPPGEASLTRYGSVLGTMLYMSPEQAAGQEVTEASDLYSFGILLQEMVSDRPPYPSLPIAELTGRVARGETVPLLDPDAELVALVEDLKRFHPAARPTAEQAAARLRGLLERPERLRRQRLRALALTGAFAALVLVLVVVSVLAVRARREAERASREAERATQEAKRANQEGERARQVAKFLSELFQEAGPDVAQGREVTAREMLDLGAARIERQLSDQPLVKASLQDTLGTIYRRLGNFETAERHVAAALAARLSLVGEDDPLVALSRSHLAEIYADQGELERAEPLLLQAAASLERARGRRDPELAQVWNDLATLYSEEGRLEAAEGLYRQSLEVYEASFGRESNEVSSTLNNLAVLRWQAGDYAQALGYYERALETKRAVVGARHPDLAALQNNLGILHRELGNYDTAAELLDEALRSSRAVLGPDHPMVAQVLYSQGRLALAEGQLDRGQALFEQSITIHRAASGDDHYEIGRGLVQLAEIDRRRGRWRSAQERLAAAFRVLEAGLGREHRWRLEALEVAAQLARDQGQGARAAAFTSEAQDLARKVLPEGHPEQRKWVQ